MNFKGVSPDLTEVYIIDDRVHDEDLETGYPLSGPRGDFMTSLLGSMDLLGKTRISCWEGQGEDLIYEDIINSNPNIIIGIGSELMKKFVNSNKRITDVSGQVSQINIKGQNFKYLTLMSPSYVIRRMEDSDLILRFSQDLYKASQIISGEFNNPLDDKQALNAHSFDEFKNICETYYKDDSRLSYDIETNARPIFYQDSRIIGFSLSNETTGVYVSLSALDYEIDKDEETQIFDYLKENIFNKYKLIIHNTQYERPYTLTCLDYEIKFDQADDTLVMARLLRNPKEGAGLKYQAQKYCKYPDWETDLSNYISGFRNIVSRIIFGPKKYSYLWNEVKELGNIFDIKDTESYSKLSENDQEEINNTIDTVLSSIVDAYTEDEVYNLGKLIFDKLLIVEDNGGILDSTIPYNWVPDKVLSKYGAVDSIATYDLYNFFINMMNENSTEKVDLHKGYRLWLEHMYVAYIMERNGMYWNDEVASQDREFLDNQSTNCLKNMLKSPLFKPFIESSCEWKYKPIILSDYLPDIAISQGYNVKYSHETEKYIVEYNGKRVAKSKIDEIIIPDNYKSQYDQILLMLFNEKVDKAKHYDDLKEIYNPSSSTQNYIPKKLLNTYDLQMGAKIFDIYNLVTSAEFSDVINSLPVVDQKFIKVATMLNDVDNLKELYGDKWAQNRKELYEGFCTMYNSLGQRVSTPELKDILNKKESFKIESLDDGGVIDIYQRLVVTGIDQDDSSTWSPEFEWMINFRLFKKSKKIISSYIDGSVGRESVVVVDRSDFNRDDHLVKRKRSYSPLNPGEDYILAAKWSPNTVETGRWRSAMHTVPWGSQVKKYYTSRFDGGITLAPDYSQMEVRTLAAISKDKNMLELFHSGKDFHTETAKKIFKKDEVSAAERRYSKTATFSLLYGATANSFANSYCNGDLDYANMVYDGFFEAYPQVREWVEERHQEVQRDHRVSLDLSGRFIQIYPDGDTQSAINSTLRKSQNYPIQGQSADLTGGVIFDIQSYIEENNMKSLIIQYVHDSIEVDVYPFELIKLVDKLKFLLNDSPMRRMGLPSKADVTLGKSLGHEIDMEDIEYNEDFTEGVISLKGFKDEIYETVDVWKKVYKEVEIFDESWKDEFVSMGDLFILKKAYTPTISTMRHKGTCKVHIKY